MMRRQYLSSASLATVAGRELLDAADTEAVRSEYRRNTARALAAGVFGSPFYVFADELFWGQDRLDMLEEAIVRLATGNLGRGPLNPHPPRDDHRAPAKGMPRA